MPAWLLAAPFVVEFFNITWGGAAVALEVTCAAVTMETLTATVVAAGIAVGVHEGVKTLDAAANGEPTHPNSEKDFEKHPDWKETTHPDQEKAGHREFSK